MKICAVQKQIEASKPITYEQSGIEPVPRGDSEPQDIG